MADSDGSALPLLTKDAIHQVHEAIKSKDVPKIQKVIRNWWQQDRVVKDRKVEDAFLLFCDDFQLDQCKDSTVEQQWHFVQEEFRLWEYFKDIVALAEFQANGNLADEVQTVLDAVESLKKHWVQCAPERPVHLIRLNSEMLCQIANRLQVVSKDHATWKYFQVCIDRLRLPLLNYEVLDHLEDELHLLQVRLVGKLAQCPNIGQILEQYSKTLSGIRQDLLNWRFEWLSRDHLDQLYRMVAKQLPDGVAGVTWSVSDQLGLELLKDIESLEQVVAYVDLALSVDAEADRTVGRWTIERALQVSGEFLKDSEESPNLSSATASSFQEASLPLPAMRSIRNALSHTAVSSLVVRQVTDDDENVDASVLRHLQSDLKKVRSMCHKALSRKRFHLVKNSIVPFRPQMEELLTKSGINSEVTDAFAKVLESDTFSRIRETFGDFGEVLRRQSGPYESIAEMVREILAECAHWEIRKSLRDLTVSVASTFAFCEELLEGSDDIDQQLEQSFNPKMVPLLSSMHSKYMKSMFTGLAVPALGIEQMAKMTNPQKLSVHSGREESWREFVNTTYEENLPVHYLSGSQNLDDDSRLAAIVAELQGFGDAEMATGRLLVLQKLLRIRRLKDAVANAESGQEPLPRKIYEELVEQLGLEGQLAQDLRNCHPENNPQQDESSLLNDFLQSLVTVQKCLGNVSDDPSAEFQFRSMGFSEGQLATLNEMLQEFQQKVRRKCQIEGSTDQILKDLLQNLQAQDSSKHEALVHQVDSKRRMHQSVMELRRFCNGADMSKAQFLAHVHVLASEVLSQIKMLKSSYDDPDRVIKWLKYCRACYEMLVVSGRRNGLQKSDPRTQRVKNAFRSLNSFGRQEVKRPKFDASIIVLEEALQERVCELESSYPGRDLTEGLLRDFEEPYGHFLKRCAKHQNGTLESIAKDFRDFVETFSGGHDTDLLVNAYRDAAMARFEDYFSTRVTSLGVLLAGKETVDTLATEQESVDKTYRRLQHDVKLQAAVEMLLLDLLNTLKFLSTKKKSKTTLENGSKLHVYDCLEKIVRMSIQMMAAGPNETASSLNLPRSIRNALAHEYGTSFSVKILFLLAMFFVSDGAIVIAFRHILEMDGGGVQALKLLVSSDYRSFETFVDSHFDKANVIVALRQSDAITNSSFWTVDGWKDSLLDILDGGPGTKEAAHDDRYLQKVLQKDFLDAIRPDDVEKLRYLWAHVGITTTAAVIPPLHQAVWHGNQGVLEVLLQECGVDVDDADRYGWTPLHVSIVARRPALTDLLLSKYRASIYGKTSKDKFMSLHLAVLQSDVAMVQLLLEHRAFPDVEAENGWTPLSIAQKLGNDAIQKALLEAGAKDVPLVSAKSLKTLSSSLSLDSHDDELWKTLEKAVSSRQSNFVENILAKRGNVDLEYADSEGVTLLSKAAEDGQERIVHILLEHGANVDARDNYLRTPLIEAVSMGHLRTVMALLNHGADVNARDSQGSTALLEAVATKNLKIMRELLDRGAKVDAKTLTGETPLLKAVFVRRVDGIRLLLERGADINRADTSGTTPLIQAFASWQWSVFRLLLENGADVEALDWKQESLLYTAAAEGLTDMAQLLLQHGADVNRTKSGRTPLMTAALHGHREVVELLINHGADLSAKDVRGKTAQSEAVTAGHADIARLLEPPPDVRLFRVAAPYFSDVLKVFRGLWFT